MNFSDKDISGLFQLLITQLELFEKNINSPGSQDLMHVSVFEDEITASFSNMDHWSLLSNLMISPVISDLESVLNTSKVAYRLHQISLDTLEFIKTLKRLFEDTGKLHSTKFVEAVLEASQHIRFILMNLENGLTNQDVEYLFAMLEDSVNHMQKIQTLLALSTLDFAADKNMMAIESSVSINHLIYYITREAKHLTIDCLESMLSNINYRHEWISDAAYYLAESRCFAMDFTLNNWIEAENAFISGPLDKLKYHCNFIDL